MAEQGSDSDSIVLPHKTTPQIAIISGSIALLVAVVGLTMTLREVALGPGPILSYAATGFFGVVSLTLGLLLLKRRSEVLAFYRLNWLRVENDYLYFSTGAYTAQMKLFDLHRQRMIDLIEQRDALVASGYLTDADRVTEVLRFISQSLPSKPPTPKY
jgi:hypothetical protein